MDSYFIKAISQELQELLPGSQIGKPWLKDSLCLIIPSITPKEQRVFLSCSCHPSLPLLYLSEQKSPKLHREPEQTEVLFQKYLTRATITEVYPLDLERVLFFRLEKKGRLHFASLEHSKMNLIVEMTGRNSNIILTNEQNIILAALRYVPSQRNRFRQILQGQSYQPPPVQKKKVQEIDQKEFFELLDQKPVSAQSNQISMESYLQQHLGGLDPLIIREICFRSLQEDTIFPVREITAQDNIWQILQEIISLYRQGAFSPRIIFPNEGPPRLSAIPLSHLCSAGQQEDFIFESPSLAARQFEIIQSERMALSQLRSQLEHGILDTLNRLNSRLCGLIDDQKEAERAEEYRQKGDLIMAHLRQVEKGQTVLVAENFYTSTSGDNLTIALDPTLTPIQNAQHYYKLYHKGKKAVALIQHRLQATEERIFSISHFREIIMNLKDLSELEEWRNKLKIEGLLSQDCTNLNLKSNSSSSTTKTGQGIPGKNIRKLLSLDGLQILIGKNDRGNDTIVCSIAQKHDLWFHAQDVAGSHVLLRNPQRLETPPLTSLQQAASLAAYYSKARKDTKVMIDYTQARYVTKPKGAKPGLVIVHQKKSILVTPTQASRS